MWWKQQQWCFPSKGPKQHVFLVMKNHFHFHSLNKWCNWENYVWKLLCCSEPFSLNAWKFVVKQIGPHVKKKLMKASCATRDSVTFQLWGGEGGEGVPQATHIISGAGIPQFLSLILIAPSPCEMWDNWTRQGLGDLTRPYPWAPPPHPAGIGSHHRPGVGWGGGEGQSVVLPGHCSNAMSGLLEEGASLSVVCTAFLSGRRSADTRFPVSRDVECLHFGFCCSPLRIVMVVEREVLEVLRDLV